MPFVRGSGSLLYFSESSHTRYPQRGYEATPTIGHLLFLDQCDPFPHERVKTPKSISLELLSKKSAVAIRMVK